MRSERAVLTLAAGKPIYWQMAINLARSFLCWHKQSDIRFCVVTDLPSALPKDLSGVEVVRLSPDKLGEGFSAKLHLDELAPAAKTLFIDADCLVVANLETVFDQFSGRAVSVVGSSIERGEWFGNVGTLCARFNVSALPKFNGGVYYIEKGAAAQAVYERARELERDYDNLGLKRLRNRPNDELLVAIAMATHGLNAVPDDGSFLSSPFECPGPFSIDVLRGHATLINPPAPSVRHNDWYPFTEVHPVLVHFLGDFHRSYQYRCEAARLAHWARPALVRLLIRVVTVLLISLPGFSKEWIKDMLRPVYHQLFHPRRPAPSPRI